MKTKELKAKSIWIIIAMFPALLFVITYLQMPYMNAFVILLLLLAILPVFLNFEKGETKAKEIVPIVVMSSLAVLGRWLFVGIADFKPTTAIIMITGMIFGKRAGFLTGAISALASNMLLGQGPWTPYQMYAWGVIGVISAVMEEKSLFKNKIVVYISGFCMAICFGWFLNLQYIIMYIHPFSPKAYMVSNVASIYFDLIHGVATVIFLLVLYGTWKQRLVRIREKYYAK